MDTNVEYEANLTVAFRVFYLYRKSRTDIPFNRISFSYRRLPIQWYRIFMPPVYYRNCTTTYMLYVKRIVITTILERTL